MTVLQVQLPESLVQQVRDLASRENVSLDQFTAAALAARVQALSDADYLQHRAARADRTRFLQALAQAPDAPPVPGDE